MGLSKESLQAAPSSSENIGLCDIDDVEVYLHSSIPADMVDFAKRKIDATSDVLRRLCRNEGWDLDKEMGEDPLTRRQAKETVAVSVAISLKRTIAASGDNGEDMSAFSTFTQSAAGYSFTGTWNGNPEDVFFTANQLHNMGIGLQTIRKFCI